MAQKDGWCTVDGSGAMGVNEGPIDRVIRVVVGLAAIGVGLLVVRGLIGIVLALLGGVAVFSGIVGFCHIYKFFGICSTGKKA